MIGLETTEEAKVESDMEIESPEAKPKKEPKPRVKRVRKPKTPAEKKEGRGRGRRKKEEPVVEDLGVSFLVFPFKCRWKKNCQVSNGILRFHRKIISLYLKTVK